MAAKGGREPGTIKGMSDRGAFFQAILDNPDDDLPRLIYADYLDERDDPHGEFIRVQVELSHLPANDPRRRPLEVRQGELLQAHRDAWVAPLRELLQCGPNHWGGWVFERGFVQYFRLRGADLRKYDARLVRLTPLQELCLQPLDLRQLTRLLTQPWVEHLRVLILDRNRIGDDGARLIAECPRLAGLRRLDLSGCAIGAPGIQALAASPHLGCLNWLDLSNNYHDGALTAPALAAAPHLRNLSWLDLRGTLSRSPDLEQRFGTALQAVPDFPIWHGD
jgi:uncharacterized protein (TIGR02996 family)